MNILYYVLSFILGSIISGLISYYFSLRKTRKEFKEYLKNELAKEPNRRGFYDYTVNIIDSENSNKIIAKVPIEYVFEEVDNTNGKSKIIVSEIHIQHLDYINNEYYQKLFIKKFNNIWINENNIDWFDKDEKRKTKQKLKQLLEEIN